MQQLFLYDYIYIFFSVAVTLLSCNFAKFSFWTRIYLTKSISIHLQIEILHVWFSKLPFWFLYHLKCTLFPLKFWFSQDVLMRLKDHSTEEYAIWRIFMITFDVISI